MNTTPAPKRLIGYARVSTVGQSLEAQLEQLTAAGCSIIFQEKASGARDDRKELARMMKGLQPGDLVMVTRTDRLARSIFQMFRIVSHIVDAGANFRDLSQPLADTTTSSGRMYLAILSGFAEVEREMIATRTAEGRARSKKRMGRRPKLTAAQRAEAMDRKASGEPNTAIARSFNVSHMTISRLRAD
ncbi:recombinase family protein [Mesorhizobium sp. B2-4-13]|uniref:recombinase family protein n=1 Tax=Mesorhizobium sp. B2-4-13 TaxID=2589936 RepID=UPI00114DEBFE|nr:recombinase family protein [Mesorhizobium sp. B2-4-13]TPK79036.1 recombinase family protein [Mesorhizobium sp. B2-4-13]